MSIQELERELRKRRRLPGTGSQNSMTPCAASKGCSVRDTKQRRRIRTRSLFPGIVSRTHQKPPKRPSALVFSRRDAAGEEIHSTIQVSDPARRGAQRYLAQEIFIDCHCSFGGPRTLRGSRCVDSAMLHWRARKREYRHGRAKSRIEVKLALNSFPSARVRLATQQTGARPRTVEGNLGCRSCRYRAHDTAPFA